MHALFARLEKVKIKNMGIFLFFVLPLGAFADPDEKQMNKLSWMKKLRIYAAGSFGNMIVAAIFIILLLCFNFFISSIMSGSGVIFNNTIANTGASEVGLSGTITEINGTIVKSMSDFIDVMKNVKPGDVIKIKTTEGIYNVKTIPNPEDSTKPFIGISGPRTFYVYTGLLSNFGAISDETFYIISWFSGLLGWILIINFGVGLFNLFPIKPLDGGLMFEEILKHFYKGKNVKKVVNCVSLFVLFLILFNLFGPSLINWLK
jgi:membrane-associated protease RseP (regulator of RpoE activity)